MMPHRFFLGGCSISILSEGLQFGRFTLRRRLGAGAFAEVWLAIEESQLGFRKEVALKMLRATSKEPEKVAALQQEARLVASLRHPNIVDVFSVEQIEETWTVVMEYVDGGTLEELIERMVRANLRMPASVVLDLGADIAHALDGAHTATGPDGESLCVLHRDIKPANVLIDSAGVAKLTDFGVAKVAGEAAATATGSAKGTPAYIAPESWRGDRDFKPTVDLFGLGCILFELATSQRLFDAESIAALFFQMANGKPAEEVAPLKEVFPEIAFIVEGLLQRDPAARYQAASDVVADLMDVRVKLDAPGGDLERFLELLARVEEGSDAEASAVRRRALPTAELAWRDLEARATHSDLEVELPSEANREADGAEAAATSSVSPPEEEETRVTEPAEVRREERSPPAESSPRRRRRRGQRARQPTPRKVPRVLLAVVWGMTGFASLALIVLLVVRFAPGLASPSGSPAGASTEPPPGAEPPAVAAVEAEAEARPSELEAARTHDPVPSPPPVRDGTPSAGSSAADPTPGREPRPSPTPRPEELPPREPAEPSPTPAAEATAALPTTTPEPVRDPAPTPSPEPATTAPTATSIPLTKACLVTTSTPARVRVWVDGALQGRRTVARGSSLGAQAEPGWITVGMGTGERPTAYLDVELVLGRSVTVHCNLAVNDCTTSTGGFGPCAR
jgi:serine/threonine-protein kinase